MAILVTDSASERDVFVINWLLPDFIMILYLNIFREGICQIYVNIDSRISIIFTSFRSLCNFDKTPNRVAYSLQNFRVPELIRKPKQSDLDWCMQHFFLFRVVSLFPIFHEQARIVQEIWTLLKDPVLVLQIGKDCCEETFRP